MKRTLTKALAISVLILTSAACVTDEDRHSERSEQILEIEKKDSEKQAVSKQRCEEEPITKTEDQECAPEILIGHATATSRDPAEIKFEIEGTNCGIPIIGFSNMVFAGEKEIPPSRGWDSLELLENENGKFLLHGEIWSCGNFRNADHIELTALTEDGETAVLRIPITFVEATED